MSDHALPVSDPAPSARHVPAWLYLASAAGIAVGIISFLIGAAAADPAPAWRALLVNFLFWSSLAQGAFIWSVAFRIARTTWSGPVNRIGHSAVWFLGITVVVFAVLFVGRRFWFPWDAAEIGDRSAWLNVPSVFIRDGLALAVLFLLALAYVRTYLGFDLAPGRSGARSDGGRAARRLSVLGVSLALVYTVASTSIGFDLVMALAGEWYSALFGWYYMLGGLYAGMAGLVVVTALSARWLDFTASVRRQQYQDLGNFLMAFAMAMTYFFFAQALVIWYENLPPETAFPLVRLRAQPWTTLSAAAIGIVYLGPFLLLLLREMKENRGTLSAVAAFVLLAMWFERYLLVEPSLAPDYAGFPTLVPLVGAGFLGLFVLTTARFLARCPGVSPLDTALREEMEREW